MRKPLRLAREGRLISETNHAVGPEDRDDGIPVYVPFDRDGMSEKIHVRTVDAGPHFPGDDRLATNLELAFGSVGVDKLEPPGARLGGNEIAPRVVGHGVHLSIPIFAS
jgi:hypothetical protein